MVTLHTIGHSNRDIETLLGLLAAHHVETLVDIRAFPRSRRYPQYDRATLASHLARADVRYEWAGDAFGGFRKPRRDSRHTALTDAAFRGFADYMESARFAAAIDALVARAACKRTAIMCAEAEHRHCHRQFIADYLALRGHAVMHIENTGAARPHRLTDCLDRARQAPVYNRNEQRDLFEATDEPTG
ncbi:MAG: DUF488 domain-containing protein [Gammaproteobacteria bacterium]